MNKKLKLLLLCFPILLVIVLSFAKQYDSISSVWSAFADLGSSIDYGLGFIQECFINLFDVLTLGEQVIYILSWLCSWCVIINLIDVVVYLFTWVTKWLKGVD